MLQKIAMLQFDPYKMEIELRVVTLTIFKGKIASLKFVLGYLKFKVTAVVILLT